MNTMTEEIQELRQLSVPQLLLRYEELWGTKPRCRNKAWLWRRCAWKLQEIRTGGLSNVAKVRLEQMIAEIDFPVDEEAFTVTGRRKTPRRPEDPTPGTILRREWYGKVIEVRVLERGFEYLGVPYRSLSAVAKAVTGSHWNGRLFFGLTKHSTS